MEMLTCATARQGRGARQPLCLMMILRMMNPMGHGRQHNHQKNGWAWTAGHGKDSTARVMVCNGRGVVRIERKPKNTWAPLGLTITPSVDIQGLCIIAVVSYHCRLTIGKLG